MENDSVMYNGQIFKTGDRITCNIDNTPIEDAKIYIGSHRELIQIVNNHIFIWLGYICNDRTDKRVASHSLSNLLGYSYAHIFGGKSDGSLSDGVRDLKLVIFNPIESIIQEMIEKDKKAIENGVLI